MRLVRLGRYGALSAWIALLVLVVSGIVAVNLYETRGFLADTAASQTLARARATLERLAGELLRMRAASLADAAAGPSLQELEASVAAVDAQIGPLGEGAARSADGEVWLGAFAPDRDTIESQTSLRHAWSDYRERLQRLLAAQASASGSGALEPALAAAIGGSASAGLIMAREFESLDRGVARAAIARARLLRTAQFGGLVATAGIFLMILFYVLHALRSEDAAVAMARAETERILATVNEGLFLLDAQLVIGQQHSRALARLLRRDRLAGRSFDELLRGLVPDATRTTAIEYVTMLWGERVNENLVKSLNPLREVVVDLGAASEPDGAASVNPRERTAGQPRHFAFDFTRVRSGGRTRQILVSVADITERVELAQELAAAEQRQQGQLELLVSVLQVDPTQLDAFLATAESAMTLVNAVLKVPAREESAFREKLDKIFREVHALKSEATLLGLESVAERAHRFEDALAELRGKQTLTGNDFLPLAVKLNDLFGHLGVVRNLVGRLAPLRPAGSEGGHAATQVLAPAAAGRAARGAAPESAAARDAARVATPGAPQRIHAAGLEAGLRQLTERVAAEHERKVSLVCVGLEAVPSRYAKAVLDILAQFVRNSVVHGIEAPAQRAAAHKSAEGTLALEFVDLGEQGYELTFQDDGRGLDHERIRAVAISRGLISSEVAAGIEPRRLVGFIFKPGFSTAEQVSRDAGRGVGMDLVRDIVTQLGGRITLSTKPGQFTRFRVTLPHEARAAVA
jgi:two-component system, chemotaxis family, sensor kinase CheA